jgi:hypothetical protein
MVTPPPVFHGMATRHSLENFQHQVEIIIDGHPESRRHERSGEGKLDHRRSLDPSTGSQKGVVIDLGID